MLAGCMDGRIPCDKAMLEAAKENLRTKFLLFGFTEHFEKFVQTLMAVLGWPELLYKSKNVHQGASIAVDGRRRRIIEDLSEYDSALFAFAHDMIEAKTAEALSVAAQWNDAPKEVVDSVLCCRTDMLKFNNSDTALLSQDAFAQTTTQLQALGVQVTTYA